MQDFVGILSILRSKGSHQLTTRQTTRQQEGDEAGAICANCSRLQNGHRKGFCYPDTFPNSDLRFTPMAQPEDETALPATWMTSSEKFAYMDVAAQPPEERSTLANYFKRYVDLVYEFAAERDALKADLAELRNGYKMAISDLAEEAEISDTLRAERDTYKNACNLNIEGSSDLYAMMLTERFELESKIATIKSQLDAVVGPETARKAWERGYEMGVWAGSRGYSVQLDGFPPYTPPLKAGPE
jgi:hypothetical protein